MTKDNSATLSEKYKRLGRFKGVLSFIMFLLIIGGAIGAYKFVTQEEFGDSEGDAVFLIIGVVCLLFQIYVLTNVIRIIDFLFDLDNK